MQNIPTWIPVVALALFDAEGRLLLQQRPIGKHHGGLWELPGGKVESGENPRLALVREIAEELGLALDPGLLRAALLADEPGEPPIVLLLYTSHQPCGEVEARDQQAFGWFSAAEAEALPLAPMDRELVHKLAR